MIYYTNARLLTMDEGRVIERGFLAVDGSDIAAVGDMSEFPATISSEDTRIDLEGATVLPACIDAHSHLGIFNDSLRDEGDDGNENTDPVTPHLRALDGIYHADVCFREAYEGGVGTVMTGPGSANVLGGQFAILSTYERTVDRAVLRAPAAQKAAFGENPKTVYGKDNKTPTTRMGTAGILREALFTTAEYMRKCDDYLRKKKTYDDAVVAGDEDLPDDPDRPDFDFVSESLLPILRGEIPLKIHAHRQDDILTAVRICNEFGLIYSLEHCTDGYLIADILAEEYAAGQAPGRGTQNREAPGGKLLGVVVGPVIGDRSKPELSAQTIRGAGILCKAGLPVAIMTDHPCVPEQYLLLSAAICVRGGMREEDALKGVTITAAELLGIDERLGSLRAGKQADFSVFTGDPLDARSTVNLFVGKGIVRYDPQNISVAPTSGKGRV